MISCEKPLPLTVVVAEPLSCASLMPTVLVNVENESSDENTRVRTETLCSSPLRKAVFSTGVLVTSWPNTPTEASTYCDSALPCSLTL